MRSVSLKIPPAWRPVWYWIIYHLTDLWWNSLNQNCPNKGDLHFVPFYKCSIFFSRAFNINLLEAFSIPWCSLFNPMLFCYPPFEIYINAVLYNVSDLSVMFCSAQSVALLGCLPCWIIYLAVKKPLKNLLQIPGPPQKLGTILTTRIFAPVSHIAVEQEYQPGVSYVSKSVYYSLLTYFMLCINS